jgi:mediator of RNA polymerase II transcription subunit 12, fungi type
MDPKCPIFDPFRNYPASPPELPTDMPSECRTGLRSLLPYTPCPATTSNLVMAHRDSSGHLILGPPVQNRPWEWIENLGDHPLPDAKHNNDDEGQARVRYPIRNSASISLDLFNARASGDGVIPSVIGDDDPRIEANIRSFEDGLSAESVFKRDWRETRIELDDDIVVGGSANRAEEVDELGGLPSFPRKADRQSAPRSRKPSPASSVHSHKSKSTGPSMAPSSARSSPLQPPPLPRLSNSSSSEPTAVIDVDAPSSIAPAATSAGTNTASLNHRASKRKLTMSDDEVEIIEAPIAAAAALGPSRAGKKPKGKTTAKIKAKKR